MSTPDLGFLVTGVVERHQVDGKWVLRVVQDDGQPGYFPIEEVLEKYKGREVRFTMIGMSDLIALTETLQSQGAQVGQIGGG
jgi:anti-sigma regulatory factor (Ser/Thr protein kinase)